MRRRVRSREQFWGDKIRPAGAVCSTKRRRALLKKPGGEPMGGVGGI